MFKEAADFFSQLREKPEKKDIFRQFFHHAYLWSSQTVPYFARVYFQNISNGAKRMGYRGTFRDMTGNRDARDASFLDNWGLIAVQSALISIALLAGIFFQLNYALNKVMAPLLDKLKAQLTNYPRAALALSLAKSFGVISGLLLTIGVFLVAPALITLATTIMMACLLTGVFAPIVLYGLFSLKIFNKGANLSQNEMPYMGHKNIAMLGLSTFFAWITPANVNILFAKIGLFLGKTTMLFSAKNILDEVRFIFNPESRKEALKNRISTVLQNTRQFIEDNFYVDIEEDIYILVKNFVIQSVMNQMNEFDARTQGLDPNLVRNLAEQLSRGEENRPQESNDWFDDLINASNRYFSQFNQPPMPEPSAPPEHILPKNSYTGPRAS